METDNRKFYGLLAKFATQEDLIAAARRVYEAGYQKYDSYSPYPVEELPEAMHLKAFSFALCYSGGWVHWRDLCLCYDDLCHCDRLSTQYWRQAAFQLAHVYSNYL